MGIKHLLGFSLVIAGMGLAALYLLFMMNSQVYTHNFLTSLGIFSFLSLLAGIFILIKSD